MDFWVDIAFAVLLRLLRDRRESPKWKAAFLKLYDAIGAAFIDDIKLTPPVSRVEGKPE